MGSASTARFLPGGGSSKKRELIGLLLSRAGQRLVLLGTSASPIATESFRHLADKILVPKRPPRVSAAPACRGVRLQCLGVQNLFPVRRRLMPPPFHAQHSAPEEPDSRVAQILPQKPKIRLAAFIGREGFAPVHATLCDVASNPRAAHIAFVAASCLA